jgi:hypothetical protein
VVRHHPTPIDFPQNRPVIARFDRGDGSLRSTGPVGPFCFRLFRTNDVEHNKLGVDRPDVAVHLDDRVMGGVMAPAPPRTVRLVWLF